MSTTRPLALVTGGGRRIGAAIAAALAGAGHDLAIHSHHGGEPEAALLRAVADAGVRCERFTADLADPQALAALLPAVAQAFGRAPAVLVNNASLFEQDRPETVTHDSLMRHYAVNCAAPVLLARDVAARGGAVVVNILDQRVAAPHGDQFAYTLGKMALADATAILARELAPGTRVCAVAPGLTLPTPDYPDETMRALAGRMPLGRLAGPQEIARAVLFLVQSGAVTGQTVFVDAGAHLRHWPRDFLFLDQPADAVRPHGPSPSSTSR